MVTIIVFFHVLVCFLLLVVILLQSSKGGGLAGAFGGTGGMGAIFGGRGAATFLSKLTVVLAIIFMLSNVVQVFVIRKAGSSKSLIQKEMQKEKGTSAAD
ncbi:preprotein translocase subunit SecG, partial [candidate division KSB1 bacterium]